MPNPKVVSSFLSSIHDRPSDEQIESLAGEITVQSLEVPRLDSVERMLDWFRSERSNGGAELTRFCIEEHPVFDWFASRRELGNRKIMDAVLTSSAVSSALPHFRITYPLTYNPKTGRGPRGWTEVWPLQLPGEWATYLDSGGAYTWKEELAPEDRDVRSSDAMEAAMAAYRGITGNRYNPSITVYRTSDPWCEWFPGLMNGTWALYDLRRREFWLLAITDID